MAVAPSMSPGAVRAAAALKSLHGIIDPPAPEGAEEQTWLEWLVGHVAYENEPGTVVDLPVGTPWLRIVVVVPGNE